MDRPRSRIPALSLRSVVPSDRSIPSLTHLPSPYALSPFAPHALCSAAPLATLARTAPRPRPRRSRGSPPRGRSPSCPRAPRPPGRSRQPRRPPLPRSRHQPRPRLLLPLPLPLLLPPPTGDPMAALRPALPASGPPLPLPVPLPLPLRRRRRRRISSRVEESRVG